MNKPAKKQPRTSKKEDKDGAAALGQASRPSTPTISLSEMKFHKSPIERVLMLSSDDILASALRDALKREELN